MASLASTAGGGSTVTLARQTAVPPRPSLTWPVTVYFEGARSLVSRSTSDPVPVTWPPLVSQLNDSGSLSGSLAAAVMWTGPPGCTEAGLAEQFIVGGRLGRGSTRTSAVQLVVPPRPSLTRAVIV